MLLILSSFACHPVHGYFNSLPGGGRTLSLGHALVAIGAGPEAPFYNPANVVRNSETCFFFSCMQPYGLKELSSQLLASLVHTAYGNLVFAVSHFGNVLYHESTLAAGTGCSLFNRLDCGILLRLERLDISKYGSASAASSDAGCILRLGETVVLGAAASNIGCTKIGRNRENLSRRIRAGIGWKPDEAVLCLAEIEKEASFPCEVKAGIEFKCLPALIIRSGFENRPSFFSCGFGLIWKDVSLDYGMSIHPVLGTTHAVSVLLMP